MIDYWVIVDTGSSDATKEIIREIMCGIPGELHERNWVNFGHNRTEALNLAKNKGDYLFFIDADEVIVLDSNFFWPELNKDCFDIKVQFGGMEYSRIGLVNNALNWEWIGVLHEYVTSCEASSRGLLEGIHYLVHTDGHRSQDPNKYEHDIELLEKAIEQNPDNERDVFYLAQSYKDAGHYPEALEIYQMRIKMGGWEEEIYWSMLQSGILQQKIGYQPKAFLKTFQKAYQYRPSRLEALYQLVYYYRTQGDYLEGYKTAKLGLHTNKSEDSLFVEKWIYDYGFLLEFSICAYWTQNYTEALLATYAILNQSNLPESVKTCAINNLYWIKQKLS